MTLYYCTYYNIIFLFLLGVATGTSVIYGREAPELQLRKMADLYFMFKMYKQAYTHYHTSKKDFYVSRILQKKQIWIFVLEYIIKDWLLKKETKVYSNFFKKMFKKWFIFLSAFYLIICMKMHHFRGSLSK